MLMCSSAVWDVPWVSGHIERSLVMQLEVRTLRQFPSVLSVLFVPITSKRVRTSLFVSWKVGDSNETGFWLVAST
jgi:hypothetical protein